MLRRTRVQRRTERQSAANAALAAIVFVTSTGGCATPPAPSGNASDSPIPTLGTPTAGLATASPGALDPTASPSTASVASFDLSDIFGVMSRVIAAQRPNVVFQLEPDELDGTFVLDGNGNDGFGEGRLFVVAIEDAGALTGHPCADRDFAQGARCAERLLDNGNVLVMRDVVEAHGTKVIEVLVIRPDRSGVSLEATNFPIDPPPDVLRPGQTLPPARVTRADPLYTVDELAELAIAIEAGIRTCHGGVC